MSASSSADFAGKVVVITGAGRGIGAAAARYFSTHAARTVLLNRPRSGRPADADAPQAGLELACDVSDPDSVAATLELVGARFGRVDVLVNNAGVIEPIAPLADSDPRHWSQAIATNLTGAYLVARGVIPLMSAAGGGTIVNISSGAATSALEGWSHYCASKAGLRALTACLDLELRDSGIRAIGLSPGTVATDMQVAIRSSGLNPVSRLAPSAHLAPEWVAKAIAWLCTSAADPYLGTDFSLKTDKGRRLTGLPPLSA